MTRRSRAREVALQLLFQFDLNPGVDRAVIEQFVRERLRDSEAERFCLIVFDGVVSKRRDIDQRLTQIAENWRLARMAAVDRNVLRIGAYELLYTPETPAAPVINEAIELARRFGNADSPAFVNGLLDRIAHATPAPEPPPVATTSAEGT